MTSYEEYIKLKKNYISSKSLDIQIVNNTKDIPQEILWQKEVVDCLTVNESCYKTLDGVFYFSEKLVNKLMYFSFLQGSNDINERSFRKGWRAAQEEITDIISDLNMKEYKQHRKRKA